MNPSPWKDAASVSDIPENDVIGVMVDGTDVALYHVEGQIYATRNLCTHGHARLCEGFLLDHEIECPLHQGRFDVRTGAVTCEPAAEPVRSYPVKIDNGRVFIEMTEN